MIAADLGRISSAGMELALAESCTGGQLPVQ